MLCERCKTREANILYTEIKDGVRKEHHFCTVCAKEMDFSQYSDIFDGEFPLSKILSGLFRVENKSNDNIRYKNIKCPSCKMSYQEFIDKQKFGCKDCYEVFNLFIAENIKQLQGSDIHIGKKPKKILKASDVDKIIIKDDDRIADLKEKIRIAILNEQYEKAARYRDEIKNILEEN